MQGMPNSHDDGVGGGGSVYSSRGSGAGSAASSTSSAALIADKAARCASRTCSRPPCLCNCAARSAR